MKKIRIGLIFPFSNPELIFLILFSFINISLTDVYSFDKLTAKKGNVMSKDKKVSEMDSFLESLKKSAMNSIAKLNGVQWKTKSWEHEEHSESDSSKISYHYRHNVNSSRGKVFEKATVSDIFIKYEKAAETMIKFGMADEGDPVDVRVLQIEIFPASPLLPMGHINLERFYGKKKLLFINLDIFPASTPETEIEAVRKNMEEVAKKYGRDQWEISNGLAVQYNMEGWEKPLAARAGFQLKMLPLEENIDLAREGAGVFIKAYLAMVEKLKDLPFKEDDKKLMNEMRLHWLEYSLMKDGAVRMARENGHPFDAIREMGLPPTVHY